MQWTLAGNTKGFGHGINDGRPFWIGNFSTPDRAQVLFYYPSDDNWWLGTFSANQLQWTLAGNTKGFGHAISTDGRPFWIGNVSRFNSTYRNFYYLSSDLHVSKPVAKPDDDYTILYGKLRAAILSRHFALNKYFRTNLYYTTTQLYTDDRSLAGRWKVQSRGEDNPLMMSGMLLASLAAFDNISNLASAKEKEEKPGLDGIKAIPRLFLAQTWTQLYSL